MMVYLHLISYLKDITLFQWTIEISIELYNISIIYVLILWKMFALSAFSNYDNRSRHTFTTRSIKTVYYGTESLPYLATKVWELEPNNIKSLENLPIFKKTIKIGNLMYALVGFADSTFHKSAALCSGFCFNFHFYIY